MFYLNGCNVPLLWQNKAEQGLTMSKKRAVQRVDLRHLSACNFQLIRSFWHFLSSSVDDHRVHLPVVFLHFWQGVDFSLKMAILVLSWKIPSCNVGPQRKQSQKSLLKGG